MIFFIVFIGIMLIMIFIYNNKRVTYDTDKSAIEDLEKEKITYGLNNHLTWVESIDKTFNSLNYDDIMLTGKKIHDCYNNMPKKYSPGIDEDAHRKNYFFNRLSKVLHSWPQDKREALLNQLSRNILSHLYQHADE